MALNFPGPYGLRIFYTTTPAGFPPMTHKLEFNVRTQGTPAPGTGVGDIDLIDRQGFNVNLDTAAVNLVTLIKPLFHTAVDFTLYELWRYAAGTFDGTFVTSAPLGIQGTSATLPTVAGQTIVTFRTAEGGSMKVHFMEPSLGAGPEQAFPTGNAQINTFAAHIATGATNVTVGRDTSMPIAAKGLFPGQNERLFKKRYRNS